MKRTSTFCFLLAVCCCAAFSAPVSAQPLAGALPPDISNDFTFHKPEKKLLGRIGFTTTIGKYERIFALDLQSGSIYPLVTGPGNNRYPTWSPDGKRMVFTSDRSGKPELYIADWNGAHVSQITHVPAAVGHPSWHTTAAGDEIIFYLEGRNATNIYSGQPFSNQFRAVTEFSGRNITPRLSPNGRLLAYTTDRFWPGWEVCIYNRELNAEACPLRGTESYCRPAWHSDNNRILYAYGSGTDIDIGLLNVQDGTVRHMTSLPNREYDPVWSPDGKDFVFVAEATKRNLFQMYLLRDGEKEPTKIVSSPYPIRYLTWDVNSTLKLEAARIRQLEQERLAAEKRKQQSSFEPRDLPPPDPHATAAVAVPGVNTAANSLQDEPVDTFAASELPASERQ